MQVIRFRWYANYRVKLVLGGSYFFSTVPAESLAMAQKIAKTVHGSKFVEVEEM